MHLKSYIQLLRPANIITAIADILAGFAIAFYPTYSFNYSHLFLIFSTIGLYGGGIVLNDAFDAKLDAVERPERPIPSKKVSVQRAMILGFLLLFLGILAAFSYNYISGIIAIIVTILVLLYNVYGKKKYFFGPLNMGLCRGGNLLLGISVVPQAINEWSSLILIPIVYIAAITMVSRGEVKGGNPKTLYVASLFYLVVIVAQLFIAYCNKEQLVLSLCLLFIFSFCIFTPLIKAIKNPIGPNIGKAVKAGVLSLILMDSVWCMAFGSIYLGLAVLLLIPLSIILSRYFAVT